MTRFALILLVLLLPAVAHAKVRVVATLADYGAVAREVGGNRVDVDVLAPHNADPHHVDPRPNLLITLNKADLLIINGLGLEASWLDPLVRQARNPKINPGAPGHFVASSVAKLIDVPSGPVDRAQGDVHPGGNPHFYLDPASMIAIALSLQDRLTKLDPAGAADYAANATRFTTALKAYGQAAAAKFAQLPASKRQIVSYHKSLGYLLRWLGLTEIATIEPKPGIPPNPRHVATVLGAMKSGQVRVVLQEQFYPTKTSETVAKLASGEVVVLPAATNFEAGESYIAHLTKITEAVHVALAR